MIRVSKDINGFLLDFYTDLGLVRQSTIFLQRSHLVLCQAAKIATISGRTVLLNFYNSFSTKTGMNRIILDCDLMRYRNTGLYHYCLNLGNYVNRLLHETGTGEMKFYVPPREEQAFPEKRDVIVEKKYHRFFKPFLYGCRIWHAPFQSGRLVPVKNKSIRVILTIHDLNPLHEDLLAVQVKKSIAHTQWIRSFVFLNSVDRMSSLTVKWETNPFS